MTMMKKIMILGAGIYQVPLIKKAKEMGLYTIVVSIAGDYPGFKFADKIYYVDTTDSVNVLKIAKDEKINGIVTAGTDVAIPTIGKVCDVLKLHGLNYKAAKRATAKAMMKDAFVRDNVRTAKYAVCHNADDIEKALKNMNLPVMFKAVDSSGSRGITKVDSDEPIKISEAIKKIDNVTHENNFIIEEYIDGIEFGAQSLVCNGEMKFFMPHGDYVFKGDTGVPIGHFVPYDLGEEIINDAKEQLGKAINALGIDECAVNADFILSNGKVYVLEIGARSGATCLAEMVSIAYNVDYYKILINTALEGTCNDECFETELIPVIAKLITSDKDGIIDDIILPDIKNKNIIDINVDYSKGSKVNRFRVGPDRIGDIIVKGASLEEAQELMSDIMDKLKICIREV